MFATPSLVRGEKVRRTQPNAPPVTKTAFPEFPASQIRVAKISSLGKVYVDFKDVESMRKMLSINGKILSRKRTGALAMEQRMINAAIKHGRFLGMLPMWAAATFERGSISPCHTRGYEAGRIGEIAARSFARLLGMAEAKIGP